MWIFQKNGIMIPVGGKYSMTDPPLVSIIIPVYNAATYLSATIESAIAQTWTHKEIIVIDDGSTDQSPLLIKAFENKGIISLRQENKGASAARNYGLAVAKGKYIQFLDADDFLSADKVESQVRILDQASDKIAVSDTIYFYDEATRLSLTPPAGDEDFIYTTNAPTEFLIRLWGGYDFTLHMVQPNAWLTPRLLIEKSGGWNEKLSLDDDGEFFARIILNASGIVKSGGLNYYRKYPPASQNNLSDQRGKTALESLFTSTLLKKSHLLHKDQGVYALRAVHRLFTDCCVRSYSEEPKLYQQARLELKKLPPYQYKIILGGPLINWISARLGWKFAKTLQHWYHYLPARNTRFLRGH
jgi:glycosyltransferase involved in cell wall biosynthesis